MCRTGRANGSGWMWRPSNCAPPFPAWPSRSASCAPTRGISRSSDRPIPLLDPDVPNGDRMALKASPEDQALLLDLQALDTKLQQLSHRAANLPELATIAGLSTVRDGLRTTVAEANGAWED